MKKYKMDLTTKTLTVTKAFAETALSNLDSEEAKIIARCRAICPDLKFAYTFCIVLMKSVCLLLSV